MARVGLDASMEADTEVFFIIFGIGSSVQDPISHDMSYPRCGFLHTSLHAMRKCPTKQWACTSKIQKSF